MYAHVDGGKLSWHSAVDSQSHGWLLASVHGRDDAEQPRQLERGYRSKTGMKNEDATGSPYLLYSCMYV